MIARRSGELRRPIVNFPVAVFVHDVSAVFAQSAKLKLRISNDSL